MFNNIPKKLDSQFLIRIIKNEVSPEESEFFQKWLSESEANKEEFGNLALLWDKIGSSKVPPLPEPSEQWELIREKIEVSNNCPAVKSLITPKQLNHEKKVIEKESVSPKRDYSWIVRAAAILFISVGLAFLMQYYKPITQEPVVPAVKEIAVKYFELTTQKGERKTFPLADGTIIYLNSESKLIYPNVFGKTSREVELIGEAYFSVTPDKNRPFKVVSGNTVTVVTGTEFNIKYRNEQVSVVVTKGSVKTFMKNSEKGIDLNKGEMISFSESNGFSKPVRVDLKHFLAWRHDRFSFIHTPLKEAMAEIERYYNLQVVFQNDSIMKKRLTGTFNTDSLDQIFSIISLTLDVKIDHIGRKVVIN